MLFNKSGFWKYSFAIRLWAYHFSLQPSCLPFASRLSSNFLLLICSV
jgi:hypothetical protein